jgi:nucleoside-diphosphate-sugar epimerase
MKRVVITGASGFIGRHAVPVLLEKGYEVHAVVRRGITPHCPDVRLHYANLLDDSSAANLISEIRPSHLLHLAWTTKPGAYWTDLDNLAWLSASLKLIRYFLASGGYRVVSAGTAAEYDWRFGYCSERHTPLSPRHLYGVSKNAFRSMLEAIAIQEGISVGWGRIFFLYGPNEPSGRLISSVTSQLLKGEPASCTTGDQLRDFLYVEDAAHALVSFLDSEASGPVNIASGEPLSIREIVTRVADKVGSPNLVRFGAVPNRLDEPALLVADVTRLREDVGWRPRFTLDSGISKTVEWWRNEIASACLRNV